MSCGGSDLPNWARLTWLPSSVVRFCVQHISHLPFPHFKSKSKTSRKRSFKEKFCWRSQISSKFSVSCLSFPTQGQVCNLFWNETIVQWSQCLISVLFTCRISLCKRVDVSGASDRSGNRCSDEVMRHFACKKIVLCWVSKEKKIEREEKSNSESCISYWEA